MPRSLSYCLTGAVEHALYSRARVNEGSKTFTAKTVSPVKMYVLYTPTYERSEPDKPNLFEAEISLAFPASESQALEWVFFTSYQAVRQTIVGLLNSVAMFTFCMFS